MHITCRRYILIPALSLGLTACAPEPPEIAEVAPPATTLGSVGEQYVHIALSVRRFDDAFVDAYFGPDSWDADAQADPRTLDELRAAARALQSVAAGISADAPMEVWRKAWLEANLRAMVARMDHVAGESLSFDAEAEALFGVVPPHYEQSHYEALVGELEGLLPGTGGLRERYLAYRDRFVISGERLHAVFRAAIDECRARTVAIIRRASPRMTGIVRGSRRTSSAASTAAGPISCSSRVWCEAV